MPSDHRPLKKRVLTELQRFLIMFAYLLAILFLFRLHEYVILRQHNISISRYGFAVIKALVLAKVMLIGDELKLGRRLSGKPLIYTIVGRSALFAILFVAFDFLEEAVRALFTGKSIVGSIADPGGSMLGSVIVATIMWVMLIPFFAFVEIGRAYGTQNVLHLLFSPRTKAAAAEEPTSDLQARPIGLHGELEKSQ